MGTATIRVEPEYWDLFMKTFPQRGSKMIRDYIKQLVVSIDSETEKPTTADQIENQLKKEIEVHNKTRIHIQTLQARLAEIKEQQELQQKNKLTDEEKEWLKEYGATIVENRGIAESYKSFQAVFKRFDYSFNEYKRRVAETMREIEEELDT